MMNEFSIGDLVTWNSCNLQKVGKIVEIIQPKETLKYNLPRIINGKRIGDLFVGRFKQYNDRKKWNLSSMSDGIRRSYKSYLVAVGNKLYWPVVSQLKRGEGWKS